VGILFTLSKSLFIIVIGLCLACLGFFTAHALTSSLVSRLALYQKGSASSLYLVAYYLGVASGSTILSPVWSLFQWHGIVIITAFLPITYLFILNSLQNQQKRDVLKK